MGVLQSSADMTETCFSFFGLTEGSVISSKNTSEGNCSFLDAAFASFVVHVPWNMNDIEALEIFLHYSDGIEVLDELWFSCF